MSVAAQTSKALALAGDQHHVCDPHGVGAGVADAGRAIEDKPVVAAGQSADLVDQWVAADAHYRQVLGSAGVEVAPVTGAALWIGVQEQHGSGLGQGPGQVGGQGGLSDSALLVDDRDDGHGFAPAWLSQHHVIT